MPATNHSKFLAGLNKFKDFPTELLWMLVVDGKQYAPENGPEGYEKREDGAVEGVLNAFTQALFNYQDKISVELVKTLHKTCMTPIKNRNSLMEPGEFRKKSSLIVIARGNYSSEGIASVYNKKTSFLGHYNGDLSSFVFSWALIPALSDITDPVTGEPAGVFSTANTVYAARPDDQVAKHIALLESARQKNLPLVFFPPNPGADTDPKFFQELLSLLQKSFIQFYYRDIGKAKSKNQIIDVIASFGQDCARNHPFGDLNNRLYINCLVNVMLIMNGMLPCIYEQPNIYECNSIPQIREIIKKGQALTQQVIDNPGMKVFGFDKPLSAELKEKFSKSSLALMTVVNLLILSLTPKTENTNATHLVKSGLFSESKPSGTGKHMETQKRSPGLR